MQITLLINPDFIPVAVLVAAVLIVGALLGWWRLDEK